MSVVSSVLHASLAHTSSPLMDVHSAIVPTEQVIAHKTPTSLLNLQKCVIAPPPMWVCHVINVMSVGTCLLPRATARNVSVMVLLTHALMAMDLVW